VGLKPGDLAEAIQKNPNAGAIVSLAGAPLSSAGLPATHPPILVVATASLGALPGVPGDRQTLLTLLDANSIQLAIIDATGSPPANASTGNPDPAREPFDQHFQILQAPAAR